MDKPLEEMTHRELITLCDDRGLDVPKKHNLKRDVLVLAVQEAIAAQERVTAPDPLPGAQLEPQEPPLEPVGPDVDGALPQLPELSPDDLLRIIRAKTESLEAVLADQDDPLPPHLAQAVRLELDKRAESARRQQAAVALRGPVTEMFVTRGGQYVSREGYITQINHGDIVGPLTHDLEHLKSQGIEFRPSRGVKVTHDQFGTRMVRAT